MTTRYIDATLGDDGNEGTIAAPWQTVTMVNAATFSFGDSVLFKRGETWAEQHVEAFGTVNGVGLAPSDNGTSGNPITFGAYGVGAKPALSMFRETPGVSAPGDWTDYGATVTNTWYVPMPGMTHRLHRMFFDEVEKFESETAALVCADFPWYVGNIGGTNRLLVYHVGNPSGIVFTDTLAGDSPVSMTGRSYITFENLDLRGGYGGVLLRSDGSSPSVPSSHIVFHDCAIGYRSTMNAIRIKAMEEGLATNHHITIDGCTIASGAPVMPILQSIVGSSNQADGIGLYACDDSEIKNCTFGQWFHSAIQLLPDAGGTLYRNKIHDNVFDGDGVSYCRAIGLDHGEFEGGYNEFYNNIIAAGLTVRSQFDGHHNRFYDNTVNGPIAPPGDFPRASDADGVELQPYVSDVHDNEITGNIFHNLGGPGFRIRPYGAGLVYHNTIADNTFINCGNGSDLEPLYAGVSMWIDDGVDIYANTFTGNTFVNDEPHTVRYRGVTMTVPEFYEAASDGDVIATYVPDPITLAATLDAIKAKTDTLGALAVTVTSPVSGDGTVAVEQGDSYPASRGRAIDINVDDPTHAKGLDAENCTVYLLASQFTWEAASVTGTAAGYRVRFEPTIAQTAAITKAGSCKLKACIDNVAPTDDDAETIVRGKVVLGLDIPAVV